ncbi:Uncharacterised protein [Mycobacteroides abscessus subsp. abscessus]|nr:Uncharacterised protein [Mycobacteroides abscessus subsp. abscessus]SIK23004.1 Uncharacterised protein [Mycobacteroides abscessus subsp. abscessus]
MHFHIGPSGACRHSDEGSPRSGEVEVDRWRTLHREQHSHHRVASGKPRRSNLVDDLFERQFLVLVGSQGYLADVAYQGRETGVRVDPGTQRNGVHEQPDERGDPVVFPVRHRGAHNLVIRSAVAVQQCVERCEQRREDCRVPVAPECGNHCRIRRRQREVDGSSVKHVARRAVAVERQRWCAQVPCQLRPPVREMTLSRRCRHELVLLLGQVADLQLQ